jgi:hypothetical protein
VAQRDARVPRDPSVLMINKKWAAEGQNATVGQASSSTHIEWYAWNVTHSLTHGCQQPQVDSRHVKAVLQQAHTALLQSWMHLRSLSTHPA